MEQRRNQYFIHTDDSYGKLMVHWLRPVDAGKESLLTTRGKHRFYELHYVLQGGLTMCVTGGIFTGDDRFSCGNPGDLLDDPHDNVSEGCPEACTNNGFSEVLHLGENQFVLVTPEVAHEITGYQENTIKLVFAFDAQLSDAEAAARLSEADCSVKTGSRVFRSLARTLIEVETDGFGDEAKENRAQTAYQGMGSGNDAMTGLQMKCLTEAFFFELLRIVAPSATGGFQIYKKRRIGHKQEFAQRVVEYIRSLEGKGFIKVDELAKAFHVDRRHLGRICREVFGKTPRELIDEERLRYICELLTTTDYTLGEIAFLSGFSNEYSMSRFFEAKKGDAPGRYRKDGLK